MKMSSIKLFKNLLTFSEEEINNRYNDQIKQLETDDGLKDMLEWYNKTYKGKPKQKLTKFIQLKRAKALEQVKLQLAEIEKADDFNGELVITVEWKKSYMWGMNPRAYTNYGFKSDSVGGCGYCKLSTATAEALNSHKPLLKLLYQAKDNALVTNIVLDSKQLKTQNEINRKYLGYGSGYGVIPSFEGGVGVTSHQNIMEKLGLTMKYVTSTQHTDVYIITK